VGPEVAAPTDAEFRMLTDLLRRHCGLHFGAESRSLFERRVRRRVRELELSSIAAYQLLLRGAQGDRELARLVDELTINETYFLRERGPLVALVEEILPELRARHAGRPLAIWSAGCSSGEEPYSVVLLALAAGLSPGRDFRIYASDISQRMLRRARDGVYREASFREAGPELRDRHFRPCDGGHRISEELRQQVDFIHLNLFDASKLALLGPMDVILCRNVLIYFDADGKRRAIASFFGKLRPGGYLLLGHAESLIHLTSAFELRHLTRELVYRRPLGPPPPGSPWPAGDDATPAREVLA
jgi:chemotaxis protein methyltransferase CheR